MPQSVSHVAIEDQDSKLLTLGDLLDDCLYNSMVPWASADLVMGEDQCDAVYAAGL